MKRLLLAVVFALPACMSTGPFRSDPDKVSPSDADWVASDPVRAPTSAIVWERLRYVIADHGYKVDDRLLRYDQRLLVTEWHTTLAPVRYEGVRRRIHAKVEPAGDGMFVVKFAVMKQRNSDIDQPMNPVQAEWEDMGAEQTRGELLAWKMSRAFEGADATPAK